MTLNLAPATDAWRALDSLSSLAGRYDVALCDVWGVIHNGRTAHAEACAALARFRAAGGVVVLVSNAPRPSADVVAQLERFGVSLEAFDRIVTSGDVTRGLIAARAGQNVLHIGPDRDLSVFEGADLAFADLEGADYCVCTGFRDDERETVADYADLIAGMARRGLTMICANPDLIVERGDRLLPCAGALAEAYAASGGEVIYAGKPHRPVYERALDLAADARGARAPLSRVIAIGDALRTDVAGAAALGVDALFVLEGIHWADVGAEDWPLRLPGWLAEAQQSPAYVMRKLVW